MIFFNFSIQLLLQFSKNRLKYMLMNVKLEKNILNLDKFFFIEWIFSNHIIWQQLLFLVPCWAPLAGIVLYLFLRIASSSLANFYYSYFSFLWRSFVICWTFFSLSDLRALIYFYCFYVFCLNKLKKYFNS